MLWMRKCSACTRRKRIQRKAQETVMLSDSMDPIEFVAAHEDDVAAVDEHPLSPECSGSE